MRVIALYFTGTGNTKYIADYMKNKFEEKGHEFRLISIELEKNNPDEVSKVIKTYDLVGILYPIYASGIPKIFRKYLDELSTKSELDQDGKGINGFSVTTVALFSGDGAIVPKKYFERMNIWLKWAYNIKMASNIDIHLPILTIPIIEKQELLKRKAKKQVDRIIEKILKEEGHIAGKNIFARLGGMMQRSGEKVMDKAEVKFNHDLCIKCGLCVKVCPMNNLELKERIETSNNCTLCLRCLHNCPVFAIRYFSSKGNKPLKQLRSSENKFYEHME